MVYINMEAWLELPWLCHITCSPGFYPGLRNDQLSYHERSSHTMMKMRSGLQAWMPALPGHFRSRNLGCDWLAIL